ncbi:MAG: hypothetical protein LBJ21_08915 [Acidobacteriota bacterium]|nr:hypothetical protein [Acidobacteriota bacterium]
MKKKILFVAIVFTLAVPVRHPGLLAQQSAEDARLIEVRRQQINLNEMRAALARTRELVEQGVERQTELNAAQVRLEQAQLNYQNAVLSLLTLQPRLSIQEAVKRQDSEGRRFVRLTLQNLTPSFDDSRFQMLNNFEGADPIPPELRTRDVTDVFVSLQATGASGDARSTIIGIPYETHIDRLQYGESRTMEFQLLRDADSLIVAANYKGQTQEYTIHLQQAETDNVLMMSSLQVSQEADLGAEVTFDLKLERSSVDVRRFPLKTINLPRQISHNFLDPGSRARLQQVNFPTGVTQQNLTLQLYLPDRTSEQVKMDEPLEFWVLALDDEAERQFTEDRIYTEDEIGQSRAGRVRLILLPRGVGRIEVAAPSLFSEILTGDTVEAKMTLRNAGTRRLDNIRVRAETPLNWRVEIEPDIVETLDVNREAEVKFLMIPPEGAVVGDYEVRIKTESYSYNRAIPTEDKLYRISIKARPNVLATTGLFVGLLVILAGVAFFLVRLTRR